MLRTATTPPALRYSRVPLRGRLFQISPQRRGYLLKLALILFVIAIPFKAAMLFDIPSMSFGMVPIYAALLLFALVFLFYWLDRRLPKLTWPKPIVYLAAYGLLVTLSALQSAQIPGNATDMSARKLWSFSLTQSAYVTACVVAAILLFQTFVAFPKFVWTALRAHFGTSLFVCLWGIYQVVGFYRRWPYPTIFNNNYHYMQLYMETLGGVIRVSSTATEPSWLAIYLVSILPIAFCSVRRKLVILSPGLDTLVLVLCGVVLLLTFTLTGFLGIAFIALILARKGELSKVLGGGLALGMVALIVVLLSSFSKDINTYVHNSGVIGRFYGISAGDDVSVSERGDSMTVGMEVFAHHPVIGVGEGNFLFYYNFYADRPESYPIIYAMGPRVLADHGLVGAVLMAAFVVLTWRRKSPSSAPVRIRWLQDSLRVSFLTTFLVILFTMPQPTHYELWLAAAGALALSTWVPAASPVTGSRAATVAAVNSGGGRAGTSAR